MNRKQFIKNSCLVCLGGGLLSTVLESCSITKHYTAEINGSDLVVPINLFAEADGKNEKKFVIVQNSKLQFPICIFKLSKDDYSALYMRCPHQGAELQLFGDKLQCPAHGSEFTNTGIVQSPPATDNLRKFKTIVEDNYLKISLK